MGGTTTPPIGCFVLCDVFLKSIGALRVSGFLLFFFSLLV